MSEPRRKVPAVDALLRSTAGQRASRRVGRPLFKACVQEVLEELRGEMAAGAPLPTEGTLVKRAATRAERIGAGLTTVINATGVVLHTGLGRAPLPASATTAALEAAAGYTDLEIDLDSGKRGQRTTPAERLVTALTGAEAAFVVNNNAGALMLALAALAKRREVLVSRGELIEIGGEFRLPDIMAASGAKLIEVGTTNRTRIGDYRDAISDKTGMILKVHPSNYRVVGFHETPTVAQLSVLARKKGIPLMHDIGSGLLTSLPGSDEPSVAESLTQGADLLCFSGDKLLGGPQAGILIGSADLVQRLRRNPMSRALRVDKMQLAALVAVLLAHSKGESGSLPTWRALKDKPARIRARTSEVADELGHPDVTIVKCNSTAGGGSLPGLELPSYALRINTDSPENLARKLRTGEPSVFPRIEDGALILDMRTVPQERLSDLAVALRAVL